MKTIAQTDTATAHFKADTNGCPQPKQADALGLDALKIYRLPDVLSWKWAGKRLLEKLIAIDYQTIPNLNQEREGTVEQWEPVFIEHPRTWALLADSPGNILGYWHFVSLREEFSNKAKQGTLLDSEISLDRLNRLDRPGAYPFYFIAMTVLPIAKTYSAVRTLMDCLFQELSRFAGEGIFFNEVCSNSFTEDGAKMNRWLGLRPTAKHVDFGEIYAGDVSTFVDSPLFCKYPGLQSTYKLRFRL